MKVCVGGTFDSFHTGHKALLQKAAEVAGVNGSVFIGVTSDAFAEKKGSIQSFQHRKKNIEQFFNKEKKQIIFFIKPISDRFGPTITDDFDAIVVSPETKATADEINSRRKQTGKKPLGIIVIPFVLARDNQPISSTRIRQKEIDEKGTLLKKE